MTKQPMRLYRHRSDGKLHPTPEGGVRSRPVLSDTQPMDFITANGSPGGKSQTGNLHLKVTDTQDILGLLREGDRSEDRFTADLDEKHILGSLRTSSELGNLLKLCEHYGFYDESNFDVGFVSKPMILAHNGIEFHLIPLSVGTGAGNQVQVDAWQSTKGGVGLVDAQSAIDVVGVKKFNAMVKEATEVKKQRLVNIGEIARTGVNAETEGQPLPEARKLIQILETDQGLNAKLKKLEEIGIACGVDTDFGGGGIRGTALVAYQSRGIYFFLHSEEERNVIRAYKRNRSYRPGDMASSESKLNEVELETFIARIGPAYFKQDLDTTMLELELQTDKELGAIISGWEHGEQNEVFDLIKPPLTAGLVVPITEREGDGTDYLVLSVNGRATADLKVYSVHPQGLGRKDVIEITFTGLCAKHTAERVENKVGARLMEKIDATRQA